jgi:hypothetical protein
VDTSLEELFERDEWHAKNRPPCFYFRLRLPDAGPVTGNPTPSGDVLICSAKYSRSPNV